MSSKKIVDSLCPEFGYELLSVLPYSYKLFKLGLLQETISGFDTKCLYFFSPKHTENDIKRSWDNVVKLKKNNFPNIDIHKGDLDWSNFESPPFKEFYKDKSIKFEKETLVIFNRYNKEWGKQPINYLDPETLDKLFGMLNKNYQIVYLNLNHDQRYFDHFEPMVLNEEKILEKYPNVLSFEKLKKRFPTYSINEIQLRIFASCEKYISSNGGQLILSAYFGGENIIFSKECHELKPDINSFYRWYHKLGGGIFHHVNNYGSLLELVYQKWVENKPLVNILIRTSERPIFFKEAINSVYSQTYKNVNIIVGVDTSNSKKYVFGEKCRLVEYNYPKTQQHTKPSNSEEYGNLFIPNLYMNDLQKEVKSGYIMYLDDDDLFVDKNSLRTIVDNIKTPNDILFWKVSFPHRKVPDEQSFGKPPILYQIDTAGFMFPSKYKVDWEPFTKGDYRISKKLFTIVPNKRYINNVLTKSERDVKKGRGLRDDKIITKPEISVIIPTYNNVDYISECLDSILKSLEGINSEILVGIDDCEKTLNYIKDKKFDSKISFYLFKNNIGPYIIKNSLSEIAKSDKLLFFDSDDIMLKNMITDTLSILKTQKMYKPKYFDFRNQNEILNVDSLKSNKFGEGVFAIDKTTFLSFNGFEGWKCAADSDFMGRFYKRNIPFTHGQKISFLRRIHPNSLTNNPETNMSSKLRAYYFGLSRVKRPNEKCVEFKTDKFINVNTQSFISNVVITKNKPESEVKSGDILKKIRGTNPQQTNSNGVDYDKLNKILYSQGVYDPKKNTDKPKIVQNKPIDRNKLIEIKKGSNLDALKKNLPGKPDRRKNTQNIFSKKNSR